MGMDGKGNQLFPRYSMKFIKMAKLRFTGLLKIEPSSRIEVQEILIRLRKIRILEFKLVFTFLRHGCSRLNSLPSYAVIFSNFV